MVIERVLTASSLWFTDMGALNPTGRNLHRAIAPLLAAWYGFGPPAAPNEAGGVAYKGGEFSPSGSKEDLVGVEFQVHIDGLMAKTVTNTTHGDLFLHAALTRLADEGALEYRPERITQRRYGTDLVVRSTMAFRLPFLDGFLRTLSAALNLDPEAPHAPGALQALEFDIEYAGPRRQPPFLIRRYGKFSENRYLSSGPFPNEQHERLLQELEKAFVLLDEKTEGPTKLRVV